MSVDFLCATNKIAVETDGRSHNEYNPHFHKGSRLNFLSSIKRDSKKEEWQIKNGFEIIRLGEDEVRDLSVKFIEDNFGLKLV